jgi:hypothetical protein
MPRFIEGQDRQQVTLLPECLDVRLRRRSAGKTSESAQSRGSPQQGLGRFASVLSTVREVLNRCGHDLAVRTRHQLATNLSMGRSWIGSFAGAGSEWRMTSEGRHGESGSQGEAIIGRLPTPDVAIQCGRRKTSSNPSSLVRCKQPLMSGRRLTPTLRSKPGQTPQLDVYAAIKLSGFREAARHFDLA